VFANRDIALQLAKSHEQRPTGNVVRPWFEELKRLVPTN
jgi:hypothetical protein